MKLSLGLSAALAGCAAARQQTARVHILNGDPKPAAAAAANSPTLSPGLARLVLLQRLAPAGKGPSTSEIPDGVDVETAVSLMNAYGGESAPLFGDEHLSLPSQLVIMLEGLSGEQIDSMGKQLGAGPSFEIENPPSSGAHDKLVKNDFFNVGITKQHSCSIKEVSNPFEERCWSGKSTVAKYNVQKQPEAFSDLEKHIPSLEQLGRLGEMETTVVLLPASGQATKWSDKSQELRRRQRPTEQVISSVDGPKPQSKSGSDADSDTDNDDSTSDSNSEQSKASDNGDTIFYAATGSIPSCFDSEDSCVTGTGNCSGHGGCLNKYAKADGSEGKESCYVCRCLSTTDKSGGLTHWAGPACSKKDVSVPFWLFAGFTLAMVGILSLAIGMLFSVGEEKLPGVIGAGVSRNK